MTSIQAKWNWSKECRKAFNTIIKLVSGESQLSYPNFNKPFVIHRASSKLQLGAVNSQDDKTMVVYSRKLNSAQVCYTTTERELLSIVEILRVQKYTIRTTN